MIDQKAHKTGRILLVQWNQSGGGARFLYELANAWESERPGTIAWSYNARAEQVEKNRILSIPALEVQTYRRSKLSVIVALPKLITLAIKLRQFLRQHQIDTFVCVMPNVFQSLVTPIAVPQGIRYVVCVHDAVPHVGERNLVQYALPRLELRRADSVVVFSEAVGSDIMASNKRFVNRVVNTVHPAWDAVDTTLARPRSLPQDRPVTIGFLGRLYPYKGLELFLEAMHILVARGRNIRFEVHGDGPDRALEPQSGNLPGRWNVGWIPEEELEPIVDGFDLLALPYKEASQSGVLAQALALGVPSVATPVGGLRQQIEETGGGIVANSVDPIAFADAVEFLLDAPELFEKASKSALESSRHAYSWVRVVEDMAEGLGLISAAYG